ncbi:MAG: outer membrane protein assembly factor BamD [Gammaproteobacteria bacterium]|nr:outer membrane protein assembly factor BamD [Gammaproteobacteria bacterium]
MTRYPSPMRLSSIFLITCLLVLNSGCAWLSKQADPTARMSAEELYATAKESLEKNDYEVAIQHFESLEARFPFGRHAQQAQLEIAYAYYKSGESDSALAALDRFINRHPQHPHADYAWYMKGLVNFNRGASFLDRLFPRDATERDNRAALQAFQDFSELLRRYPNSRYAEDASLRVVFLHNGLARHEINVAEYYIRRGAPVAAINRARFVLENYQRTPAVADALVVQVKGYRMLGMDSLAKDALRVLRMNYPEHAFFDGQADGNTVRPTTTGFSL